ncbi:hypothetical protein ABT093_30235 [Kitasatospora sp. NPDC002551]|uniref:hypothetical protein n=1 Tax=unclassified Kitasatospora TaxID=2633591 RepID=UPI0033284AA7
MKLAGRITAVAGGLGLALGTGVALAPTASATAQGCYYHVLEDTPNAGKEIVQDACTIGAGGGEENFHTCYHLLRGDYVPAVTAADSCRRAPK